jgi:predicted dehydrogenase
VNLGIAGCGGMGRRHLYGVAELRRAMGEIVSLTAVADKSRERADDMVAEAEKLLGRRPAIHDSLDSIIASGLIDAVDITAPSELHEALCVQALEAGLHTIVEKPLATTIPACLRVLQAARASGRCLAIAENLRREPWVRLVRTIINSGLLGDLRLIVDHVCDGSDAILLTPWRHLRFTGGILLDDGVHTADVLEYLAGPVDRVAAAMRLSEPRRRNRGDAGPVGSAEFYRRWVSSMPREVKADAEDELVALLQFRNGAMGSVLLSQAAHGEPSRQRLIYGSKGSLQLPADRSGQSPILTLDGRSALQGTALVEAVPDYHLDDVSAAVFGCRRPVPTPMSFAEIDRKLIAIELGDFVNAAQADRAPEVDGPMGTRNVALTWAMCEAAVAEGWVNVDDVESGRVRKYQTTLGQL